MLANPSALITGPGEVTFKDEPVAETPGADEVLIKTRYSLISPGTELAIFQKTHVGFADPANLFAKYPFRAGYAAVGQILAVGAGVSGFAQGEWVYYRGRHQAYAVVKPETEILLPLPKEADPRLSLFARIAQISTAAPEVAQAAPGADVAVLGLGLVGNLAAQLFRQRGYKVLAVDLVSSRCEIAQTCGIRSQTITAADGVAQVRAASAEAGPSIVVEATGHPAALVMALQMTARGGETILLGSTRGKVELDIHKLIHSPGIAVRGAHEGVLYTRGLDRVRDLTRECLIAIATKNLIVKPLLSQVLPCHGLQAAYESLIDDPAKTIAIVLQWAG